MSSVLVKDPEVHNKPLADQFEKFIVEPLRHTKDTLAAGLVIVIDALDECTNNNGVDRILAALLSKASDLPVKFFVTSRPEPKILDRMRGRQGGCLPAELRLHDLDRLIVQEDIRTYLKVELEPINLPVTDLERLVKRSGVLFIYAATVARYLRGNNFSRSDKRFEQVLNASVSTSNNVNKEIDALYTAILQAVFDDTDLEDSDRDEMRLVLHTVVCAREPLTADAIAGLLVHDHANGEHPALRPLDSVLHVSETSGLVTTLHESFPDYMLDQTRSKKNHCNWKQHHERLAHFCFELMKVPEPPFNICGLESSYLFDEDVFDLAERADGIISTKLFYACRYWGAHMELAAESPELVDALYNFLSVRLLLWMEVLNIRGCIHVGARLLYRLQGWSQSVSCSKDLRELIQDAWRFVIAFSSSPVSGSMPHIYISALQFWPDHRPISRYYSQRMQRLPLTVGTAMKRRGSAPLAVCDAKGRVYAVVFSSDGTRIVSGSEDNTIRIWDAHTGQMVGKPLKGHTSPVGSVGYLSDGTRIVSGSSDNTIRIWDAHTGQMVGEPLEGHTDIVCSVGYSSDDSRIVSGSDDNTIRIWDAHTGQMVGKPLQGHTSWVMSAGYSSDGTRIVSGSWDNTIRIWDALTGQMVGKPLEGHTGVVNSVGYSSDDTRIVSGSSDKTIRIWDAHAGQAVGELLQGHAGQAHAAQYSHTGRPTASGTNDPIIHIGRSGDVTGDITWMLDQDGWVVDEHSRLLMWVPPDARVVLMRPQNVAVISRQGSLTLDFSNAMIGESWYQCYRPSV